MNADHEKMNCGFGDIFVASERLTRKKVEGDQNQNFI